MSNTSYNPKMRLVPPGLPQLFTDPAALSWGLNVEWAIDLLQTPPDECPRDLDGWRERFRILLDQERMKVENIGEEYRLLNIPLHVSSIAGDFMFMPSGLQLATDTRLTPYGDDTVCSVTYATTHSIDDLTDTPL